MSTRTAALVGVLLLGLSGCGFMDVSEDETKDWSASQLYSEAHDALKRSDYEQAVKFFEILEARYPFGRYAEQALLEGAYASYKYDEPDSAIASLDRFIKTYPTSPNLDYAYYLKGLVNFNRGLGLVERYLPTDISQRDAGAMYTSFQDFAELVRRFPNSRYSEDARLRMAYLRNNLAQYEVHVANYYMRRGAFVAAVGRAKYVVEHYPQAPAMPEALGIMAKAYKIMKLDDLSADALRVLETNYPGNSNIADVRETVVK